MPRRPSRRHRTTGATAQRHRDRPARGRRSEATARAVAFVAAHRDAGRGPRQRRSPSSPTTRTASPTALTRGLAALADPEYLDGQQRVAPGHRRRPRRPLAAPGRRPARLPQRDPKGDRPTPLLFIADRLFHETRARGRAGSPSASSSGPWPIETERTWQLLRRAAREAGDWITVDSLAHPYGKGIAAEPYRWAELEQLVYSPSRWERRLVGSTIATMTHVDRRARPRPRGRRATPCRSSASLMGDAEPDVQKALVVGLPLADASSTARRPRPPSATRPNAPPATTTATAPGSSATRSPSSTRPSPTSFAARLAGIRKRAGAPATSAAAETAARFGGLPDPTTLPRAAAR